MNKMVKYTTPKGVAQYPYLDKPDTKFNPQGDYKLNLVLDKKNAKELMSLVDNEIDKKFVAVSKEVKGKRVKKADPPYLFEMDDDGNETGNIVFKLKQKAEITSKTGKTINMKVRLFDAKGKPLNDVAVWGGSLVKCAGSLMPYYTPTLGVGVSMKLAACQVIDLVTSDSSADTFGFNEEDGYEAEQKSEEDILPEEEGHIEESESDF
tara:strand:- start:1690 stop:2313 length:624 start_codon:yes stop_codon:yes gene_type:complete